MILKVVYDDNSQILIDKLKSILSNYPLIELESYHEGLFKERKKAFGLKGSFSARLSPFAVLYNSENNPIKAFYSEVNECTLDNIIDNINKYSI